MIYFAYLMNFFMNVKKKNKSQLEMLFTFCAFAQKCCRLTSSQESKEESNAAMTWAKGQIYNLDPSRSQLQQWTMGILSLKIKMKLSLTKRFLLCFQLFLFQFSTCLLGTVWSYSLTPGDKENLLIFLLHKKLQSYVVLVESTWTEFHFRYSNFFQFKLDTVLFPSLVQKKKCRTLISVLFSLRKQKLNIPQILMNCTVWKGNQ